MKAAYLLASVVAAAIAVGACGDSTETLTDGRGNQPAQGGRQPGAGDGTDDGTTPGGTVPTNSPEGKAFYKANVHPFMAATCGSCHDVAGPGPNWLTVSDSERSYAQAFQLGYVVTQSRIVTKPAHGGSTANVLNASQAQTYETWVAMELKDGGNKATPSILEKLGTCFNRTKFDAMKMQDWRTTRRTNDNNTNNVTPWNENANNCTGCNNAPCTTCHSADPATNFVNAVGNTIQPKDYTFDTTKLTNPAFITKYFGVSADGKAVASAGIKKKSDATMKDKAYTHPMFTLNTAQQTALDAFVGDVVTKFNAGTCVAAPPTTPAP